MMVEKGRHEYMYVEESHVLVRHMIRTKPPKAGGQLRETLEGLNLTQRRAVHTPLAMHLGGGARASAHGKMLKLLFGSGYGII